MKVLKRSKVKSLAACPGCQQLCKRHSIGRRRLKDLGSDAVVEVRYSKHYCSNCGRYFSVGVPYAARGRQYTDEVRWLAVNLYSQGFTLAKVRELLIKRHGALVATSTIHTWWAESRSEEIDKEAKGVRA